MSPPEQNLEQLYQSALQAQAPTSLGAPIEETPQPNMEEVYRYARGEQQAPPMQRQQLDQSVAPNPLVTLANRTKDPEGILGQMAEFGKQLVGRTASALQGYGPPETNKDFVGPQKFNRLPDAAPPGESHVYRDAPDYETHIPLRPISAEHTPRGQVPFGRADAAAALESAFKEARKRGIKIGVTSAHRESDEQAELYRRLGPGVAAPPGVSAHERGMAFDLHGDLDRFAKIAVKYGFSRPFANDPREQHHFTFGGMKTEELSGSGKLKLLSKKNKADLMSSEDEAKNYRQLYATAYSSGIDRPDIVSAQIDAESGGRWEAISPAGALGKFQIMPGTRDAALKQMGMPPMTDSQFINSHETQIKVYNHIFGNLLKNYKNYPQALAAYNAGDGGLQTIKTQGFVGDYKTETLPYVAKILSKVSSKPVSLEEAARLIREGPKTSDEQARWGYNGDFTGEPTPPANRLKQYGDPGITQALSDYMSSMVNLFPEFGFSGTHKDKFNAFSGALGFSSDASEQMYKRYLKNGGWHPEVGQPLDSHLSNMFLNQARGFIKNMTLGLSEWIPGMRTPKADQKYMEETRQGLGAYMFPNNKLAETATWGVLGLGDLLPELMGYVVGPGKLGSMKQLQTLLGAGKTGARLATFAKTHPVALGMLRAMGEEFKAAGAFFSAEMNQRMATSVLDEGKSIQDAFVEALPAAKHNALIGIVFGMGLRLGGVTAKATGQFANNLGRAAIGEENAITKNVLLKSLVWDNLPKNVQAVARTATSKAFFETPQWMKKGITNLFAKEIDIFGEMRNRRRNFHTRMMQADALEKTVTENVAPLRDSSNKILEEMQKKEKVLHAQNTEAQAALAAVSNMNNPAAEAALNFSRLKPQYDDLLNQKKKMQERFATPFSSDDEMNAALKMKKDLQDEFKQVSEQIKAFREVPGFDDARKTYEAAQAAGEAWTKFSTEQLPMRDGVAKIVHTADLIQQELFAKSRLLRKAAQDPAHDIDDVGKTLDLTEYIESLDLFEKEKKVRMDLGDKDLDHLQELSSSIHNWAKQSYMTTPEEIKMQTAKTMRQLLDGVPSTVENARNSIGYISQFFDKNTKAGQAFRRAVPEKTRQMIADNLAKFDTDLSKFLNSPGSEIVTNAKLAEGIQNTAFDALEMAFSVPGLLGATGGALSSMVRSVRPVEAMADRQVMLQKLQDVAMGKMLPAYGSLMDAGGFRMSDLRQHSPAESMLAEVLGEAQVRKAVDREFFQGFGPLQTLDRIVSFATNLGRSMTERGKVTFQVAKAFRAHTETQLLDALNAGRTTGKLETIPMKDMEELAYALDDKAELRKYFEKYPERKPMVASIVKSLGYIEEFKLNSPEQAAFFNSSYFPHRYPLFREYREKFGQFDNPDRGFYDEVVSKSQSSEYSRKYKTIKQAEGAYKEAQTEMDDLRRHGNQPVLTPEEFLFDLTTWQDRAQALGLPLDDTGRKRVADLASKMLLKNPNKNVGELIEEHFATTMLADAQRSFFRLLELGEDTTKGGSKTKLLFRRPRDEKGNPLKFDVPIGEVGYSTWAKRWYMGQKQAEYEPISKIIGVTDVNRVGDDPLYVTGKASEYGNPKEMGDIYVHPQVAAYIKEHFNYKPAKLLGSTLHSQGIQSLISGAILSGTPYAYFNQVFGQMYKQANFSVAGASHFIDLGRFASQDAAHEHIMREAANAGLEQQNLASVTKVAGEEMMQTFSSILEEEGKKWYQLPSASQQVGAWMGYLHDSLADKSVLQKAGTLALAPFKGLIAADRWIQERTLFEAVRSAQMGAWMVKSNELMQQQGPAMLAKGMRQDQVWGHVTKTAADMINKEFGMMPKWWVADSARKAFFSSFLTPQVMNSRLSGMVNVLDSLIPGRNADGSVSLGHGKFGNQFNHMDELTRQNVLATYRWQALGAMSSAFIYANVLQWTLSKTWTNANPPGREFDVKIGDYYISNPFFGHLRPVAKLFSNMYNTTTGHTSLRDVISGVVNTASPVWRAGFDAVANPEGIFEGETPQGNLAQQAVNSMGLLSEMHGAVGVAGDMLGRPDLVDKIPLIGAPTNTFTGLRRSPIETPLSFAGVYPAPENPKNWYKGARVTYKNQQSILKTKIENALMSAARDTDPELQNKKMEEAFELMRDGQAAPDVIRKLNTESSMFMEEGQSDPDRILLTEDQINNIIAHVIDPQSYAVWKSEKGLRPILEEKLLNFKRSERTTSPELNKVRDNLFKQGALQ